MAGEGCVCGLACLLYGDGTGYVPAPLTPTLSRVGRGSLEAARPGLARNTPLPRQRGRGRGRGLHLPQQRRRPHRLARALAAERHHPRHAYRAGHRVVLLDEEAARGQVRAACQVRGGLDGGEGEAPLLAAVEEIVL